MILFTFLLISGPVLILCLLVRGLRLKARQDADTAQGMALYAARLEGQLSESEKNRGQWREHAREALKLAQEKHFPPDTVIQFEAPSRPTQDETYTVEVKGYIAPVVTNCSRCGVSIRHPPDVYPVRCPAADCGELIDPVLDDPPTF